MRLLGATHNVWCSMASAAVVGATMVGAAAVGLVVFDQCSRGTRLAMVWRVVCCMFWRKWCNISAAVVGVMSGVLYGAAVVGTAVCAQQQWVLPVRWMVPVEPCVAQCRSIELSRRARHAIRCTWNKARRCETLTEEDTIWQLVRKRTWLNVRTSSRYIERDSVRAS